MQNPTLQCPHLGQPRLTACLGIAYKDQPYGAQCRLVAGAEHAMGGGEISQMTVQIRADRGC